MKPNTIEVMTDLVIEGIKDELKEMVENAEYTEESDSTGLREMATNCRNIIDTADALENLLLTAADEIDRIEIAAREAQSNNENGEAVAALAADIVGAIKGAKRE